MDGKIESGALLLAPFLAAALIGLAAGWGLSEEMTAADWMAEGNAVYGERHKLERAEEAFHSYQKAAELGPDSVEARWKTALMAWWVTQLTPKKKDQRVAAQTGIDHAKAALILDPDSAEAHFWLGACYGAFGEAKGILKSLFLVKPIRNEMNQVLRLNKAYLGGGAYRVLGVVDYKVPGFAGGSKKRSLENLNKALEIAPKHPFNLYYTAEYYKIRKKKDKARELLDLLDGLTPKGDELPGTLLMRSKAEILRKKL